MKDETKEEYLARHRKETGKDRLTEELGTDLPIKPTFRERFNTWLFMAGLAIFIYFVLQIFGMMKSN